MDELFLCDHKLHKKWAKGEPRKQREMQRDCVVDIKEFPKTGK